MNLRRTFQWTALLAAFLLAVASQANDPSPEALVEGNHWKRAKALLEPRVQANANDAQSAYLLSRVLREYRDFDAALKLVEKAAGLDPKNAAYRWQVAEVVGAIADKSANPFKRLSYGRRYRREAEAAIGLDPKHVDARWGLMEWHMQAGAIGGEKQMAFKLAQEIAVLNPARGFLAQARLAELEKKKEPLEPYYLKALEADPQSFLVRMKLADFYTSDAQRKYDLAEKHAREAAKLNSSMAEPYESLAKSLAWQKRWQDLETLLAQAEKAVADNLSPYYYAADALLADSSDLPRAERYLRKYLTQVPEPDAPSPDEARKKLNSVAEQLKRKSR